MGLKYRNLSTARIVPTVGKHEGGKPTRRQVGGITNGFALHNPMESSKSSNGTVSETEKEQVILIETPSEEAGTA